MLDISSLNLRLPRFLTSVIKTEYALDLPWSEENYGYLYSPVEEKASIMGIFGEFRLPVIEVDSFIFAIESDQLSFENEPISIRGIGFLSLQLSCSINLEHQTVGKDQVNGDSGE